MEAPPRKGGYPSRQRRFGPAPLASFEDLPTDDQDSSPEAPDTLLPSSEVSTPQVEGDFDSLATLTPCGSLRTANGSPCSPVAPPAPPPLLLEAPAAPASADSLTPEEPTRRKGSWTELFLRGRSPQRSTGTSPEPSTTTKGFFSSLLKLGGRKSPRSPSPHSPSPVPAAPRLSVTLHDDQPDGLPDYQPNSKPHNEPDNSQLDNRQPETSKPVEKTGSNPRKQQDGTSCNERPDKPNPQPDNKPVEKTSSNPRKWQESAAWNARLDGVAHEPSAASRPQDLEIGGDPFDRTCLLERACQSLADIPSASRRGSRESPDDQLSSESELALDSVLAKQSSQDEFETLLAQDSVESEEFLSSMSSSSALAVPSQPPPPSRSPVPSRQQRLEVVTIPIERPRSTTPINIAPLEAFLPVSPEPCPPDKIRLFLPGEQFTGRGPRSPRRGSLKSWLHFCEEGLQSPRCRKRSEDSSSHTGGGVGAGCCDCLATPASGDATPHLPHPDCPCDCHQQSPGSSSLSSPEHAS